MSIERAIELLARKTRGLTHARRETDGGRSLFDPFDVGLHADEVGDVERILQDMRMRKRKKDRELN